MDRHLTGCPDCRAELETERDLFAALSDPRLHRWVLAQPPPLPRDFTRMVMARVEEEYGSRAWRLWPWLRSRWTAVQWTNAAYAFSAVLVVSAGANESLRAIALNYVNPIMAVASGAWADMIVWLVQHPVAHQVLAPWLGQ